MDEKKKLEMVEKVNPEFWMLHRRIGLFNTHFQNFKQYGIPKAQLILADVPYNIGKDAYGSNPSWYIGGDNKNGESELAGREFFDTDKDFRPREFMHFCSQMLRPEPKDKAGRKGDKQSAPCMVLFCAFDQQMYYIDLARQYGLNHYIPLVFRKNWSAQVLKANMKIVGNCEYGLVLYRDKLPKFNNGGRMVFNCMDYPRDPGMPKVHPTQKPISLLQNLIRLFTDPDDVVIDPVAGSGSSLVAAAGIGRKAFGFEIKKNFYKLACNNLQHYVQPDIFEQSADLRYREQLRKKTEAKSLFSA